VAQFRPERWRPTEGSPGDERRFRRQRAGSDAESEPRLALKPDPPAPAHLDGAWWPPSTQLATELPGLVARLSYRLGQVALVGYHLDAWTETPPQVEIAGHTVELLGVASDEPNSVIVVGQGRHIALLVIPPDASAQVARQELDAASEPTDAGIAVNHQVERAADRSVTEVAARLTAHEGSKRLTLTDRKCAILESAQLVSLLHRIQNHDN
jgi:Family of unknown function (DUF5994)